MKKILFIAVAASLISCTANVANVQLQRRTYNEPAKNEVHTREIGDKLILQGEEDYQDAVRITSISNDVRLYNTTFPYSVGKILPLSGQTAEYKMYFLANEAKTKNSGYYGATNEITYGIAVRKSDNKPFVFINQVMGSLGGLKTKDVEGLSIENTTFTDSNCKACFKQEFIFNGKVDNNLKFVYREYSENMARPAFTQDLQYDINESKTVGFKGLRIEVIKATNTQIEYKILSDFTK
ncbi:hypothetical protein [Chryseobacterium terrae]|uniref:Lipoprotein n=1 Tax=Chryseobacterium terrae TaxID=3163299 RepID=A0ABW8Y4W7_9FLAO